MTDSIRAAPPARPRPAWPARPDPHPAVASRCSRTRSFPAGPDSLEADAAAPVVRHASSRRQTAPAAIVQETGRPATGRRCRSVARDLRASRGIDRLRPGGTSGCPDGTCPPTNIVRAYPRTLVMWRTSSIGERTPAIGANVSKSAGAPRRAFWVRYASAARKWRSIERLSSILDPSKLRTRRLADFGAHWS